MVGTLRFWFAQPELRKPVCSGTAGAGFMANFVNRAGPCAITQSVAIQWPVANDSDWIPPPAVTINVNLRNYVFPVRVMLLKVCRSAAVMACMAIRAALACPIQKFASPTVITRLGS